MAPGYVSFSFIILSMMPCHWKRLQVTIQALKISQEAMVREVELHVWEFEPSNTFGIFSIFFLSSIWSSFSGFFVLNIFGFYLKPIFKNSRGNNNMNSEILPKFERPKWSQRFGLMHSSMQDDFYFYVWKSNMISKISANDGFNFLIIRNLFIDIMNSLTVDLFLH